jgi:hypothetical protein
LKNPDSPNFLEYPDFFLEYPGFTLKTLIHKCCASPLLITSHFHILLLIQMVKVKVRRETEEPSTQRRTKARHDPAALRAVQETLAQEGSQRSSRPRRGDPPSSYAEGSEEEIEEEEEERTESDGGDEEDETYEQTPKPPRRHGKGPAKEKPRYEPHPKKIHQAPYVHQSRAATRVPPKHKQGVAAQICPKTPPRLIPTLPPNVRVVDTPIKLRDPGSVIGFAEHMIRDYSKNALAVREQREENVYLYLKGEGLEARFWCDFHRDFYQSVIRKPKLASKNMAPIVQMKYIDWKYYEELNNTVFNSVIEKCKEVVSMILWGLGTIGTRKFFLNSIVLTTTTPMTTQSLGQHKGTSAP